MDELKKYIKEIIDKLNNVTESMEKYYKIFYDLSYNFNIRQRNYEILENINSIQNYIRSINRNEEVLKIGKIIRLYNDINIKNNFINVLFDYHDQKTLLQLDHYCLIAEAAYKFLTKSILKQRLLFIFNGRELEPESGLSLINYGITNCSKITVV